MNKKTMLLQIEITEGRAVIAYFVQDLIDDDGSLLNRSNPHTVCLTPDADLDKTLESINADITVREGMKWNPVNADDWARVSSHCSIEHTPEVKAAYAAWQLEQAAKRQ